MFGTLRQYTETELLEVVLLIMSNPDANISPFDHTELEQINSEFVRRGHADLQTVK